MQSCPKPQHAHTCNITWRDPPALDTWYHFSFLDINAMTRMTCTSFSPCYSNREMMCSAKAEQNNPNSLFCIGTEYGGQEQSIAQLGLTWCPAYISLCSFRNNNYCAMQDGIMHQGKNKRVTTVPPILVYKHGISQTQEKRMGIAGAVTVHLKTYVAQDSISSIRTKHKDEIWECLNPPHPQPTINN